jgi:lysyl-tRNA synthetase, class II
MLLLVTAPYLWRRRQSALRLALALLAGLTVLDLMKGLDVEAASGSVAAGVVLWLGRDSFYVRYDPDTLRSALRRVPLLAAASLFLCGLAVWIAAPESAGFGSILRETGDALLWQAGPSDFQDELGHPDEAIGVAGILTLVWCAYLLFRPLAVPRVFPGAEVRTAARELVRRHGANTLAYFKLRHDQHYLFGPDGSAFLGYRVEAGVLLVSGDPVGSAAVPSFCAS